MAERALVPTCPACEHAMTTDEMISHKVDLYSLATDEERAEIECPSCGVTYHCQGGYRAEYTTALEEGDL